MACAVDAWPRASMNGSVWQIQYPQARGEVAGQTKESVPALNWRFETVAVGNCNMAAVLS